MLGAVLKQGSPEIEAVLEEWQAEQDRSRLNIDPGVLKEAEEVAEGTGTAEGVGTAGIAGTGFPKKGKNKGGRRGKKGSKKGEKIAAGSGAKAVKALSPNKKEKPAVL